MFERLQTLFAQRLSQNGLFLLVMGKSHKLKAITELRYFRDALGQLIAPVGSEICALFAGKANTEVRTVKTFMRMEVI
jgi:hypothetical protein